MKVVTYDHFNHTAYHMKINARTNMQLALSIDFNVTCS